MWSLAHRSRNMAAAGAVALCRGTSRPRSDGSVPPGGPSPDNRRRGVDGRDAVRSSVLGASRVETETYGLSHADEKANEGEPPTRPRGEAGEGCRQDGGFFFVRLVRPATGRWRAVVLLADIPPARETVSTLVSSRYLGERGCRPRNICHAPQASSAATTQ